MTKTTKILVLFLILLGLGISSLVYALDDRAVEIKALASERRVALVIGNGAYKNIKALQNPVNDAHSMERVLNNLGFKVFSGFDLTQKAMKRLISQFGDEIKDGGVGLFYFAGHGIQVNGENYLIPIDAEIHTEKDVDPESVNANDILNNMAYARNRLNIVILDACRDNPFKGFRSSGGGGLAQMKAPEGTFIAYATAPGSVASDGDGKNGLYTQELIKNMQKPGVPIELMFKGVRASVESLSHKKQTPWEASSITGDFYFKIDPNKKETNAAQPTPSTTQNNATVEKEYWDIIKNSSDPADFNEFLKKFPESPFASAAEMKIKQLEKAQQKEVQKEASIKERPPITTSNASNKYIDNGNGTITDSKTGLMWTKKDSYTDLNKCLDWNASKNYVSGLKTGGHSDWRMPSVDELKSLYDETKSNITFNNGPVHLDPIFASGGAYWYWSAEEANFCCAKFVLFYDGTVNSPYKPYCDLGGVRAVRSGH